jgi:hypothetical protein
MHAPSGAAGAAKSCVPEETGPDRSSELAENRERQHPPIGTDCGDQCVSKLPMEEHARTRYARDSRDRDSNSGAAAAPKFPTRANPALDAFMFAVA